jgi:N-acylglucosamine 2-epimerase
LETVGTDGEFYHEASSARVVNPGHDIECSWFLMEEARRSGNKEIREKAELMFNFALEKGWDKDYNGVFYFVDALDTPAEACEQDMKLWWPHNELVIASLMLYRDTGKQEYLDWFTRAVSYCRGHFIDNEYGEWYGYLRRDGTPTRNGTKGTFFKGAFHLPRMLMVCGAILDEIMKRPPGP